MSLKCEQVHEKRLRAAGTSEAFALHLAALEWSLAEPIIIDKAEDIKSRPNWRDRFEPYEHQVQNLFTFCRRLPVTILADDVGLGKTISAGLILSELMIRRRVSRTLVLCPKILAPQWVEELDSKFGITAKVAAGTALNGEIRGQVPVVVTTYDSARTRLEQIEQGSFDMLILDEAHKLRNLYGTAAPPAMALRVREALGKRLFKYVLMLTATPIQNRIWDLYSLIDCLVVAKGHENPLGTPEEFKVKFIAPGGNGRRLQPGREQEFRSILRQYLVRTRRGDAKLKFPEREVKIWQVFRTPQEQLLTNLVAEHIGSLNPMLQTSLAQALMSSPQALVAQMENMARNGTLPAIAASEAARIAASISEPAKLTGLLALLNQLRDHKPKDWRVVVFTLRKETQQVIGNTLKHLDITYGFIQGGEARNNQTTIQRFRTNPPEAHVIISTDAGAEGINLQVANVLVNYDLPWNPMIVEQRIGRVQRLASAHEYVVVCNLVVAGSVEEKVVGRLLEKLQVISHAIGDIEAILESVNCEGDGDDEDSFEKKIRELVVKSLRGQDVTEATELARESIDRAKRHLEEQHQEMDDTLGSLDALHRAGPSMPKLKRLTPTVPAKDFVLRAKQAEGVQIEKIDEEIYQFQLAGYGRELATFDENAASAWSGQAVFMGMAPKLYLPGKPPFEKLTQHWVDESGHFVRDFCPWSARLAEKIARGWCATIPGAEFLEAEFTATRTAFQGSATVKARASNAVDSYEKLIKGKLQPKGHASHPVPCANEELVKEEILPSEILPNFRPAVARVVEADLDIGEFCRFYEARRQGEAEKTGGDPRKLHKVNTDFTPMVFAEVVALQGSRYEVGEMTVRFTLDGTWKYQFSLDVIPATGQILQDPPREACAATNRVMPKSCLGTCDVSKKVVLKHLLVRSEVSGRFGLSQYAVMCSSSGRCVLEDEVARSALTGKVVAASLLKRSPVSQRLGLPEDFARCEVTGIEVLRDELTQSQVSCRLFRVDEKIISAVSGTVGHRSEFILCQESGQPILPSESGRSDVSGRVVRKDLLHQSAKPPGRLGTGDEFVQCASTGQWLLRDEVTRSVVSGKWLDRDLLRPSARSGQLALPEELVTCEESGAALLPAETGRCTLTGKLVDSRLLAKSQVSGAQALAKFFVRCAKTQKLVLPAELVECDLTKMKVLPSELEFCAVSGRRVLRDRLLKSDFSDRFVLPEKSVRSAVSKKICIPDETVECTWLEGPIAKAESGVCKLTGCTVAKRFLNLQGELIPLRELLDGNHEGADDPELIAWLKNQANGSLKGLKRVWCSPSPHGGVQAVCGEARTLLGLRIRFIGMLLRVRGQRDILGRCSVGYRTQQRWIADRNSQ